MCSAEANPVGCARKRNVIMETAQLRENTRRHELFHTRIDHRHADQVFGQHRQDAATMGEDEFDIGAAQDSSREQQACDRSRRVDRKLDDPVLNIGIRFLQQSAAVGCTYTIALRRLSSSITGTKAGSPSQRLP